MQKITEEAHWHLDLGASSSSSENATFKVWAPDNSTLSIQIEGKGTFPLHKDSEGFFSGKFSGIGIGDQYFYRTENGQLRPDPVSRSLPQGVHGPTEIINAHAFEWQDKAWKGIEQRNYIFYEIHVGTFTPAGTFQGIIEKLSFLKTLGITCIEIMPISEFPGRWNWGYDGVSLYAPSHHYGGPEGLKKLVNACHEQGIAVCLDVVYNHLGPEGNYLSEFGPYFTDIYRTPWGKAFNFDGPYSTIVRDFIIKNALYWISEYHIDALRLDAIHCIYDFLAIPMLVELREAVNSLAKKEGRHVHLIAENDLNNAQVIRPESKEGWDFSAVWNDDFHHALHVVFTEENHWYYEDFHGLKDLAEAIKNGFVYQGRYSQFRKKKQGNNSKEIPYEKWIVFIQNHDQIGNRPNGERLSSLLSFNQMKLAAAFNILTPALPLLFMGQEYNEKHPFEYFVNYENQELMNSVFEGRKKEFNRLDMAYPGEEAFERSKLGWDLSSLENQEMFQFYCQLIAFRKANPCNKELKTGEIPVVFSEEEKWIGWEYPVLNKRRVVILCHFGKEKKTWTDENWPFGKINEAELQLSSQLIFEEQRKKTFLPHTAGIFRL